jgi:hypothetical protein
MRRVLLQRFASHSQSPTPPVTCSIPTSHLHAARLSPTPPPTTSITGCSNSGTAGNINSVPVRGIVSTHYHLPPLTSHQSLHLTQLTTLSVSC